MWWFGGGGIQNAEAIQQSVSSIELIEMMFMENFQTNNKSYSSCMWGGSLTNQNLFKLVVSPLVFFFILLSPFFSSNSFCFPLLCDSIRAPLYDEDCLFTMLWFWYEKRRVNRHNNLISECCCASMCGHFVFLEI